MGRHTAMMLAVGLLATGCADIETKVATEVPFEDRVDQPDEEDTFDGFTDPPPSEEQWFDDSSFVGQGSFSGDLAYVKAFEVQNAFVQTFSIPGGSSVWLEGMSNDSPVMVMVDMLENTFADLEVGRAYSLYELPQAYTLGCVGPGYETEVPGEDVEVEDVEEGPQPGETLYTIRLGFHYDGQLQHVRAQVTQPR